MLSHIRIGGECRADKRYASAIKRRVKNVLPTHCGAEGTSNDMSPDDAREFVAKWSKVRPDWVDDVCPDCRDKVNI